MVEYRMKASDFTMIRLSKKTHSLLSRIKADKRLRTLEDAIVYLYNDRNRLTSEASKHS